jgi:phytol kinase
MALEAVAWRGLDNVFVPVGAFLLLRVYLDLDVNQLLFRLGMAVALFGLMLVLRRQTTLNEGALLGAAFAAYVFGAVGGWRWLVAPLTLLVTYATLLSPRTRRNIARIHTVHSVLSVGAAGFLWLFLGAVWEMPAMLYLFTVAFACHLAIIGAARVRFDHPQLPTPVLLTSCVLKSWALILLPYALLTGRTSWLPAAAGAVLVALAAVIFYFTQPGMEDCPADTRRWVRQALVAGACSALGVWMV